MKNNRLCVISAGWLLISTLLLNFLSACTSAPKHPATADGVLSAMMNIREAEECPDGRMRSLRVDTASLSYLSPTLVTAMYGEASRGWFEGENAPVSDMAMFLSEAMHPCELAVFRCADERDGLSVAAQCRSRLDLIKNAWKDSAYATWTDCATVTMEEEYVLLIVAPDPAPFVQAAKQAIKAGGE